MHRPLYHACGGILKIGPLFSYPINIFFSVYAGSHTNSGNHTREYLCFTIGS
jgi:hypothetical protein